MAATCGFYTVNLKKFYAWNIIGFTTAYNILPGLFFVKMDSRSSRHNCMIISYFIYFIRSFVFTALLATNIAIIYLELSSMRDGWQATVCLDA